MITGETILCYAPDPWAGLWRNRHQIMTRLAQRNTVLYIEQRIYLRELSRRLRAGQIGLADLRRPTLVHQQDGLWLYRDPIYAPYADRLSGGALTAWVRRSAMRRALKKLGSAAPILWLLRPFHADQIGHYSEKLVVYHVTDEYSCFPAVTDVVAFARQEEALIRRADLVLVTSPGLLTSKGCFNPHTYLVPNAVDYAGFQAALAAGHRLPALDALPTAKGRPRIGYVGALNKKVDFELIAEIARARPDWQFVMVGALDQTGRPGLIEAVQPLPNVYWLGRLPVEQVPAVIAAMDVCLLPYQRDTWTANIDSLKLYEYLACGKPVVATDVPAARVFERLVHIVEGGGGFVAAIEMALAEHSPALVDTRRAAAAANTWDMRVAQIEGLLVQALQRKVGGVAG